MQTGTGNSVNLFYLADAGFFLSFLQELFKSALLFRVLGCNILAVHSPHGGDVDAAHDGFYLSLYRDVIKNLFVSHESHDLGAHFCLYNGKFRSAHQLGRLVDDSLGQSGLCKSQSLLIYNQHGHILFVGIDLFLLFRLLFLRLDRKSVV